MGHTDHLTSPDIAAFIAKYREMTTKHRGLAFIHALQLDRQLRFMGYLEPLTYGLHGVTTSKNTSDDQVPNWSQTTPGTYSCLQQAELSALTDEDSLSMAFSLARGPEIAALNLLYANYATDIDSLWLHFLNKYLAHHSLDDKNSTILNLSHSCGNRFDRLQLNTKPVYQGDCTNEPLVSVIMPIYNASATLKKAAESILNQTWRKLELILVDDHSQDNSLSIAKQIRESDSRVKVLPLPINGGPYVAKNQALPLAKGQFLTVQDADDWAFPTRLAQQIQPLLNSDQNGLTVTMGHTLRCDINGKFTRFQPIDWFCHDGAMRLCFPSPLFKRSYFDHKLGAWHGVRVGADTEIIQRIKRFEPEKLQILNIPVMLQLDRENSLTRHPDTYNDERGEAPTRLAYRKSWSNWHASQLKMPKTENSESFKKN